MVRRHLFLLLALASILASKTSGMEWEVGFVDSSGEVHEVGMSLAIDFKGCPHISYATTQGCSLAWAYWDGVEWLTEMVYWIGCPWRCQTSLSLDNDGNPHISYGCYYGLGASMMYSFRSGDEWQHSRVPDQPFFSEAVHNDIAIDDAGCTHVAYVWTSDYPHSVSPFYFVLNCQQPCAWFVDTLYMGVRDGAISLALDREVMPHVCYNFDWVESKPGLRYATCRDGWYIEPVDTVPWFSHAWGTSISMDLDITEHPHVSYYDDLRRDLKWARKKSHGWEIGVVDSAGEVGSCNSLILDNYGQEHVAYYDASNRDLKCAHWNGLTWDIERIDTTGAVGDVNSIAIDGEGCLHVSYYDATNRFLKYARSTSVHTCSGNKGDIDDNGVITVIDVVHAVRHILSLHVLDFCSRVRADCNSDGVVDVSDIIGIVNVILERGSCPP